MEADRWERVKVVFEAALHRNPAERESFVRSACEDDEALYQEIMSLLEADQHAHSLLEGMAIDAIGMPPEVMKGGYEGKTIGPYEIIREIGAGGMGVVYLARRTDGKSDRPVALKLIRRGMDSEKIIKRFKRERQILAQLRHPNICQLLSVGVTSDNLPYLAMEFIEGEALDHYCDRRCLPVRERLALYQSVCRVVQYAHRNLIVHRDLKPDNILVDESGTVKLLDFGISKVLKKVGLESALTQTGMRLMTPEYASPEQIKGEKVTIASDVYALGVILFELLTGLRPFQLSGLSVMEMTKAILIRDPERPAKMLDRLPREEDTGEPLTTREAVCQARAATFTELQGLLNGELDNICLMALRKDPQKRYGSAELLRKDIQSFLEGKPVSANRLLKL